MTPPRETLVNEILGATLAVISVLTFVIRIPVLLVLVILREIPIIGFLLIVVRRAMWLPFLGFLLGSSWLWERGSVPRPVVEILGFPMTLLAGVFALLIPDPESDMRKKNLELVRTWPGSLQARRRARAPAARNPCPYCKAEIQPGDIFCQSCGMRVVGEECPRCGRHLRLDAKFCHACGYELGVYVEVSGAAAGPIAPDLRGLSLPGLAQERWRRPTRSPGCSVAIASEAARVVWGEGKIVRVLDLEGDIEGEFETGDISDIAVTSDGSRILTGRPSGGVAIYDRAGKAELVASMRGEGSGVSTSLRGHVFAAATNQELKVWDEKGYVLAEFLNHRLTATPEWIRGIVAPNGSFVVFVGHSHSHPTSWLSLLLSDTESYENYMARRPRDTPSLLEKRSWERSDRWEKTLIKERPGHGTLVAAANHLVAETFGGKLSVFDINGSKILDHAASDVTCLRMTSNGEYVFYSTSNDSKAVHLLNVETNAAKRIPLEIEVLRFEISEDGSRLVIVSDSEVVLVEIVSEAGRRKAGEQSEEAPLGGEPSTRPGQVDELVGLLGDVDVDLSPCEAAEQLVQIGEEAVQAMVKNLRASSYIPWILGRIGSKEAVEPLCALLRESGGFDRDEVDHGHGHCSVWAARALGLIGDKAALPALEEISRTSNYGEVLSACTDAIAQIRQVGKYSPQAMPPETLGLSKAEQVGLAGNPNTMPETLDRLASSNLTEVVICVAQNPSTPAETLRKLNKRFPVEGKRLYWQFVNNPSCPGDILEEIVRDCGNKHTVALAREHPNFKR